MLASLCNSKIQFIFALKIFFKKTLKSIAFFITLQQHHAVSRLQAAADGLCEPCGSAQCRRQGTQETRRCSAAPRRRSSRHGVRAWEREGVFFVVLPLIF
jgi:hypothetical protein